jgi:DNA/RNA endonuclease G (NUC1)
MKLLKLIFLVFLLIGCNTKELVAQELRNEVIIENNVFKVWYSEVLEQPVKLIYTSTNRVKNVDRGNTDFHTEKDVHTSDKHDYYRNPYDKGHLAPAATYSDTQENLYTTFSYLNCTLQQQDLNRGAWRFLEAEERVWDDSENLTITIENIFDEGHEVLPTGGHIPTDMIKHIYFENQKIYRCWEFENIKPIKSWKEYEVTHVHLNDNINQ